MITIEINERTKAGKIILEVARIFSKEDKGVNIIESKSKNIPNKGTERILQENDKSLEGVMGFDSVDALFEELDS